MTHCDTTASMMRYFFSFKFKKIFLGGNREMNGIRVHDVKSTKNSKFKKKSFFFGGVGGRAGD